MNWKSFPKVELHLHLDISLGYEAAVQLEPSLTPELFAKEFIAPSRCTNLVDFLKRVPRILELLQTEKGLNLLVEDMFRQLREDGLVYAELRFAPLLHTHKGLDPEEVVRIVESATEWYSQETGVESRLILCSLRHYTAGQSLQTVQLVDQFRGSRVVGFDLAGDEAGYPLTAHLEAFRFARDRGIAITSHAGEAAGAQSIWDTLRLIHPSRIGHGVCCIEDPALMEALKRERIHLETCPTCNVQLNVFPSYAEHPIDRLYREGLSVGVSTDNRTLTPITLSREYEMLETTFGWGKEEFLRCNLNALRAAFLPEAVKQELAEKIKREFAG
jgi:adenosine deaminase